MSETAILGATLALGGGFMDAYSYLLRDEVFANAQTGNMLLFGVYISEGNFSVALRYFFPVISFAIGIVIAELIRNFSQPDNKSENMTLFHWRQIALLFEIVVLFIVSFMPIEMNLLANGLTSLGCGIQVQSFRKIHGNASATTMCIGNLRSAMHHMCTFMLERKRENLRKCVLYFGIILSFVIGAIIGNQCVNILQERAILICILFLLIAFGMMFVEKLEYK